MRILLATWGSTGDLHPFLALGRELLQRGHRVTLAGNPQWREKVEETGLQFLASGMSQASDLLFTRPEILTSRKLGLHSLQGLMEVGLGPVLEDSYVSLCAAAAEHDLLVSHHIVLASASVAETTGIPWVTVALAPGVIRSQYSLPASSHWRAGRGLIHRGINHSIWELGRHLMRPLVDQPINEFRKKHGLRPIKDGFSSASPRLHLQLYSRHFAPQLPDWTSEKKHAGFCYWEEENYQPPKVLEEFLSGGEKPWLFTLGTAVVNRPGEFFSEAIKAMHGIPEKAILLAGPLTGQIGDLPSNVLVIDYSPFQWIMPRCQAVAHQCGIGTLSHALRAGIPSVLCPIAFDQPNNATRLVDLGVGKYLPLPRRSAKHLLAALREVSQPSYRQKAGQLGEKIRYENGPALASDLLEKEFAPQVERNLALR